ncbi:MAG: response regulator transcription factor [Rhodospirillaceae bacterium]|nr:MAG: response regulator transcription factor [Rhodospirillaceae bacterium]
MTAPQLQTNLVTQSLSPLLSRSSEAIERSTQLLLVDDDNDYREAVSDELGDYGFDVTGFGDAPDLINHFIAGNSGEIIVLDWSLPSIVGTDLLPVLRRHGVRIPVIILTGRSETLHEVEAFDRGAIDFVDKSRGIPVLARRARLIVSAAKSPGDFSPKDSVEYGHLILRPRLCRAYWRGHDLDLTVTEFNIVNRLVASAGEHVSYRSIYDCVHHCGFIAGSGEDGYRTNVRSSIKRIRNKFRAIDPDFVEIENFPAFGYLWRKCTVLE